MNNEEYEAIEDEGATMYIQYATSPDQEPEPQRASVVDNDVVITSLAWDVINGHLGIGDARRVALGDHYEDVMTEVRAIRRQNGTNL